MIHFGQMKCGKVDQFGRLFHVVSEFFHVNFVPLFPLRSYLVLAGAPADSEFSQLPIPLSLKSVVIAWIRTALVLLILLNAVILLRGLGHLLINQPVGKAGLALGPEHRLEAVLNPLWLVIGFAIFFGLTYRFSKASWTRALHLGVLLGFTEADLENHLTRGRSPAPPAATLDAYTD